MYVCMYVFNMYVCMYIFHSFTLLGGAPTVWEADAALVRAGATAAHQPGGLATGTRGRYTPLQVSRGKLPSAKVRTIALQPQRAPATWLSKTLQRIGAPEWIVRGVGMLQQTPGDMPAGDSEARNASKSWSNRLVVVSTQVSVVWLSSVCRGHLVDGRSIAVYTYIHTYIHTYTRTYVHTYIIYKYTHTYIDTYKFTYKFHLRIKAQNASIVPSSPSNSLFLVRLFVHSFVCLFGCATVNGFENKPSHLSCRRVAQ
jgi:hypothetical protein